MVDTRPASIHAEPTSSSSALARRAEIRAEVERSALRYFLEQAHPQTGMVRDWAENFSDTPANNRVGSIAATGFGFVVVANAARRGWVDRDFARAYVLKTLRFCRQSVARHKGWFLHFVDWETGERAINSEYSTIDTALLLAGALYAARVLEDPSADRLAHELYREMDFPDMLTDGGQKPRKLTLSRALWPGQPHTDGQWDMYAEHMILLLMGLGSPTHPLPREAWLAWDRSRKTLPNGKSVMGLEGTLFLHQYSQLFIDFQNYDDGFPNYHANSRVATEWHRELMSKDQRFKTLREGFWGFSAGQSPKGYEAWDPTHYAGTVCIGCTVGSAMLWPEVVLDDLVRWRHGPYAGQIWGRYGFTDSIDLDQKWFSSKVLGITVGPGYMAMANLSPETSIWRDFMQMPEIQVGLARARGPEVPLAGSKKKRGPASVSRAGAR